MLLLIDKIRKRLLETGCYLFCATIALPIRYNNIAIAIMVLGWICELDWKRKWDLIRERRLLLLLPLVYFAYLLGLLYSANVEAGIRHLEVKSTFLIFPIILGSSVTLDKYVIRRILNVFVFSVSILCAWCVLWAFYQYMQDMETGHFWYYNLVEPIGVHPIYLANYAALSIVVLLCNFDFTNSSVYDLTLRLVGVVSLIYFIILLSALSVLAFVFSVGLFLTFKQLTKFSRSKVALFVVCFAVALGALVLNHSSVTAQKISKMFDLNYSMDDPDYKWNSLTIRMAKWRCSMDVIKNNVSAGVGTGDEQDELMLSYQRNNFKEGIRCEYNSHNQYLSTFMSIGIFGLIILLSSLLIPLGIGFRDGDTMLVGFILLMMVGFLTENMLSVQKGTVFFSFFYLISLISFYQKNISH